MSKYIYNHIKDPVDTRDKLFHLNFAITTTDKLPNSVDLRRSGLLPPVLDQQSLGSCTANATSNALRFLLKKNNNKDFQPSRLFIYYFTRFLENSVDEDAGCIIRNVMKAVSKFGACSENLWGYKVDRFKIKPDEQCQKAGLTHTKSFKYMSVKQNLTAIKNALAQGFPIVFGISVYESFESQVVMKSGNVCMPKKTEENLGGHCILLVAYDDTSKLFTFMNSWGTKVGQNGYFTIPYSYVLDKNLASDFWICTGFV